jgi:hypothetical protein
MTAYEELEMRLHTFLNSTLRASKCLASRVGLLLLPEKGSLVLDEQGDGWYPELV